MLQVKYFREGDKVEEESDRWVSGTFLHPGLIHDPGSGFHMKWPREVEGPDVKWRFWKEHEGVWHWLDAEKGRWVKRDE